MQYVTRPELKYKLAEIGVKLRQTNIVCFSIPKKTKEYFKKICKSKGLKQSEYLRILIQSLDHIVPRDIKHTMDIYEAKTLMAFNNMYVRKSNLTHKDYGFISVVLEPNQRNKLDKICNDLGISRSTLMSNVIKNLKL